MNLVTKSEFDLIGQEVVISDSKNKEIVGIKGQVTMETKNMFAVSYTHLTLPTIYSV